MGNLKLLRATLSLPGETIFFINQDDNDYFEVGDTDLIKVRQQEGEFHPLTRSEAILTMQRLGLSPGERYRMTDPAFLQNYFDLLTKFSQIEPDKIGEELSSDLRSAMIVFTASFCQGGGVAPRACDHLSADSAIRIVFPPERLKALADARLQ